MGKAAARILVVDDFEDVRDTTGAVLAAAGYTVMAAPSAEQALALLARDPPPDLLFTDIVLGPGPNGFELAQRAVRLLPALKVLYATGYAWNLSEVHAAVPGSRMLQKPYRAHELLQAVDLLLEGPAPTIAPPDHEVSMAAPGLGRTRPYTAVLVVEDDDSSRKIAIDLFAELGLVVFDAWNGRDALALLAKHPEVGVLFADVRLPGMSGVELAEEAKKLRPDVKIALTSAYIDATGVPGTTFIPKPWPKDAFAALATLLTRR